MRIAIDRLNLNLPPGYEARAAAIARLVGEQLARLPVDADRDIRQLSTPVIQTRPLESDAALAGRIARAIHGQLGRPSRSGGTGHD
jgi:hypothetical protein